MNDMIGILGAGKTGRGFLARLVWESGVSFVFFDHSKELIDELKNGFEVAFFSERRESIRIDGYRAYCTDDIACADELSKLSLLLVSVGGANLEEAGRWLAGQVTEELLNASGYLDVILCENARDPSKKLKKSFLEALPKSMREKAEEKFGFTDAAVFCTTIEQRDGGVDINSEDYPTLPLDISGIKGVLPKVAGFQPIERFENVLMRKIYTYNSASAVIAYLGWWKGYQYYGDAANDPEILELLDAHYEAIGKAICEEYGYSQQDQAEFAALSKAKFCNRSILDTIARNADEPQRKLSAGERIAGPAALIEKYHGDSSVISLTAAVALLYDQPEEAEWIGMKSERSLEELFSELSGFEKDSGFFKDVFVKVKELTKTGKGIL